MTSLAKIWVHKSYITLLPQLEIIKYHVDSGGRISCEIAPNPKSTPAISVKTGMFNHKYVQTGARFWMCSLKNKLDVVSSLISTNLLQGYFELCSFGGGWYSGIPLSESELRQNYIPIKQLYKTDIFKKWHEKILAQVQQILTNKQTLRNESIERNARLTLKYMFDSINRKDRIGIELLRKLVEEELNNHIIENVMK